MKYYDIKMANYIPKPEIAPYQTIIKQFNINQKVQLCLMILLKI